MKTYFVHYYKDFRNTYNLYYCETAEDYAALPEGAERITRKEALRLASAEAGRRKFDQSCCGNATSVIFPAAASDSDIFNCDAKFFRNGCIMERR